jgi:hypothetical protein
VLVDETPYLSLFDCRPMSLIERAVAGHNITQHAVIFILRARDRCEEGDSVHLVSSWEQLRLAVVDVSTLVTDGDKDYYSRDGWSEVPCIAEKPTVEEELHGFTFDVLFWARGYTRKQTLPVLHQIGPECETFV